MLRVQGVEEEPAKDTDKEQPVRSWGDSGVLEGKSDNVTRKSIPSTFQVK